MSLVTFDMFELRFGSSIPLGDQEKVEALLSDACAQVGDLVSVDYADADMPAAIVGVICTAARRAYENPQGLTGETIGNYTWQGGRSNGVGIYFTFAEQRIIRRAAGTLGMVSVTLTNPIQVASDEQFLTVESSDTPILYFAAEDLL